MFDATYRILKMFTAAGPIRGRKKLQKMVYLLRAAGTPFHFKYKYHHFGPYSAELQSEISELIDKQLLMESIEEQAYVYEVTEQGKLFLMKLEQQGRFDSDIDPALARQLPARRVHSMRRLIGLPWFRLLESAPTQMPKGSGCWYAPENQCPVRRRKHRLRMSQRSVSNSLSWLGPTHSGVPFPQSGHRRSDCPFPRSGLRRCAA